MTVSGLSRDKPTHVQAGHPTRVTHKSDTLPCREAPCLSAIPYGEKRCRHLLLSLWKSHLSLWQKIHVVGYPSQISTNIHKIPPQRKSQKFTYPISVEGSQFCTLGTKCCGRTLLTHRQLFRCGLVLHSLCHLNVLKLKIYFTTRKHVSLWPPRGKENRGSRWCYSMALFMPSDTQDKQGPGWGIAHAHLGSTMHSTSE